MTNKRVTTTALAAAVMVFMGPALAVGVMEALTNPQIQVTLLTSFFGITTLLVWMARHEVRR